MIIITGAAGFIGSCMAGRLNREGFKDLVLVDDFSRKDKEGNLSGKAFTEKVDRDDFFPWIDKHHRLVQFIFHLGARTDTTEQDEGIFRRLNLDYSICVWEACVQYGIPLVYASSAATYGAGEQGYGDNHSLIEKLRPMNPYGQSKQDFDLWVLKQKRAPGFWAGLKFFNVYGPNECHKGRMASVVFHAYKQAAENGEITLFRSHRPDYEDGKQKRDFIYVMDVLDVMVHLMHNRRHPGIYNLGTGRAGTFLELAQAVFRAMKIPPKIRFIDTPADIRDKYQYFTEARMEKLGNAGYQKAFTPLEKGVGDYVTEFLMPGLYY